MVVKGERWIPIILGGGTAGVILRMIVGEEVIGLRTRARLGVRLHGSQDEVEWEWQ